MTKKTDTKTKPVAFHDYGKDIAGAIKMVAKDGEKLRNKIQNVGLSIITAWGKRDIEPGKAAEYFTDLGKASGYHGKALANWVALHTPLKWSDENKCWYAHVDDRVNGDNFKAARDEPFWEVTPPAEPKPFDGVALLEALIDKNSKRTTKGQPDDKLLEPGVMALLRDALQRAKGSV
jgi:hypothetical protein